MQEDKYLQRGVSAAKEDVHLAIKQLNKGLYPNAFCKVYPDYLGNDESWVNLISSDGSGTKSILAYLYWKETGDTSVWENLAKDVVAMNLDDLLCVGAKGPFLYSSLINRNKKYFPAEVLSAFINGTQSFFDQLNDLGIQVHYLGGETADLGDSVRTVTIDASMTCRAPKNDLILTHNIKPGDVLVGLASYGQCSYETEYNSGIGSNGLTSARHDLLNKHYAQTYPESYDPETDSALVYCGKYRMTDQPESFPLNVGKMLLSPTRSFAPLIHKILKEKPGLIHALIHCTGGGQSKVLHYIDSLTIEKEFDFVPPIFEMIQAQSKTSWHEMYKVYNMGYRMNVYCNEADAKTVTDMASMFNIEAKIIGRVTGDGEKKVIVKTARGTFEYN